MKLLRLDLKSCLFYVCTLGIEFAIIFNIFNLYFLDGVITDDQSIKLSIGGIFILILFVVLMLGYSANDFFVKRKGKETAVELISGLSLNGLTLSVLLENIVLSSLGIMLGFLLGFILAPQFINVTEFFLNTNLQEFQISKEGLLCTITVIFIQVMFLAINNVGLGYRTEICDLVKLSGSKYKPPKENSEITKKSLISKTIVTIIFLVLCLILTFACFLRVEDIDRIMQILTVFGAFGYIGFIFYSIPFIIDEFILSKKSKSGKYKTIVFRSLKKQLEESKSIIISFSIVIFAMIYVLADFKLNSKYTIVSSVTFTMVTILLIIITIYKVIVNAIKNIKTYKKLFYLGYSKHDLNNIIKKEMIYYNLILFGIPTIQLIFAVYAYISLEILNKKIVIFIIMFIFIIYFTYELCKRIYKKIIFNNCNFREDI